MARGERNQPAGHAANRKADGGAEGDRLRVPIVRVYDIDALIAKALAERKSAFERYYFVILRRRALREGTALGANDHLAMPTLLEPARQRQQQILTAAKILAGVDMSDFENACRSLAQNNNRLRITIG